MGSDELKPNLRCFAREKASPPLEHEPWHPYRKEAMVEWRDDRSGNVLAIADVCRHCGLVYARRAEGGGRG